MASHSPRPKCAFLARGPLLVAALLCPLLPATGTGQMAATIPAVTLDLNPAPGNQGQRETRGVRQGQEVVLEIFALREARGSTGFTASLAFDPAQLSYVGFEGGGLIPGMQVLPLLRGGTLEVGGSRFGGGAGAAQDGGTLGLVRFRTTARFGGQTALTLTRVRFRKRGEMKGFDTQIKVTVSSEGGTRRGVGR